MNDAEKVQDIAAKALPDIQVNDRPLRVAGQESLAALTRLNDKLSVPRLYVQGGEPVRVKRNEGGELRIQDLSTDHVLYELTRAADFYRQPKKGDPEDVFPPRDVARYVLSATRWALPALSGITTVPTFRPDGSVLHKRGYDPATGLVYDPPEGFEVSVPETPSAEDVRASLRCLNELIGDFPYADQASLANTLAMALTPVLREVIDGPTPLAAIDKPTPGTGATLLVECLSIANSGSEPGALGAEADDNESRKAITAALRQGSAWLFFDNVSSELKNPALARALTAGIWEDRILGVSKTLRVPIRNVWSATGNNLELSLEMARRSYWIRLDARLSRPWERDPEQFQHPDLKAWVREHRAEVLTALLTLGRNWFAAGRPTPEEVPRMGSFEAWSATLAGVLHAAGVEGFLANASALYERASEHVGVWTAFIQVLYDVIDQPDGNTATELVEKICAQENTDLREVLPDTLRLDDENLNIRIGKQFREHLGVRYGEMGLYIERIPGRSRTNRWIVRAGAAEADEGHPTLEV
jgi:putative DNA primase/helicase